MKKTQNIVNPIDSSETFEKVNELVQNQKN